MPTDSSNDVVSALKRMREASPELNAAIERTLPRRRLAHSLVGMRIKAELTRKQLARKMGRDEAFISRLESTAGSSPAPSAIADYASACGYASGYLFVEREPAASGRPGEHSQIVNLTNDERDHDALVRTLGEARQHIAKKST